MVALWASGCQTAVQGRREGRWFFMLLTGQSQCWRSGSDFPRNSLERRRRSMSQTGLDLRPRAPQSSDARGLMWWRQQRIWSYRPPDEKALRVRQEKHCGSQVKSQAKLGFGAPYSIEFFAIFPFIMGRGKMSIPNTTTYSAPCPKWQPLL